MAKGFSIFVEIAGSLGSSFTRAVSQAEGRLKGLSSSFRSTAIAARAQASEISDSMSGIAKMAAAGGIVFSVKHAFEGGEELAHELSNLKNSGRSADEVAEGLRKANEAIVDMPTATLTNSIKLLNETTGAYGDFKHAVENLKFNSKLGDVLKNSLGVQDPAHELGSLVKTLEIRGSAGNAEKYKAEAEKLGQAMIFYSGRLKSDDLYTFASNAATGIKQLDDRFLTRIAPALIQEQGGDKVGTGLTAFRAIISGRKITDKKQAEAWKKLGLLNDKDLITNKMGDVTGWKDGAISETDTAYKDPFEFMEKTILPRLQSQGVDISDQVKLGQALNTLFKNTKANAFVTMLSTQMDIARLHKDENLMNGVSDLGKIYSDSLLNDPKMASEAIRAAMTNIGSALTLPLMKPFAQTMISIAGALNHLSHVLIENPGTAGAIAKVGAALMAWQAIRFANLVFGISAFARVIGNLSLAVPLEMTGAAIGAFMLRLRGLVAGVMALQAVGGARLVLSALAGSTMALGRAVLMFPLTALRGIAMGMWALVANPVGLVLTAIVAALAALSVWIYNNWGGIVSFFKGFGDAFMKALGPSAAGAIGKVVDALGAAWRWISNLLGPIDATGEKWKAWGEWAGKGVGTAVNALVGLPGVILDFASKAWHALVDFDWAAAGRAILSKIGGVLGGVGGYLAGKLGFGGGDAPKIGTAVPLAGARALGGPVTKGLPYLVGERGPELFVPAISGKIETNRTLRGIGDGRDGHSSPEHAAKTMGALNASVMPIVFTGSIDEATRRAGKLAALLAAIQKSEIGLRDNRGGFGGSGDGSSPSVEGGSGRGNGGSSGSGYGRGGDDGATPDAQSAISPLSRAGVSDRPVESGLDAFNLYGAKKRGEGIRPINPNGFTSPTANDTVAPFRAGKGGKGDALFDSKSPQVMARLKKDFGLDDESAAAVLGNLGHESAGFKAFAEGGNGPGRGWAQWTSKDRKQGFFAYAAKHHLDPKSDEANYGYLRQELKGNYHRAIDAVKRAHGIQGKVEAFERIFEGAGVKAYGSRVRYAQRALAHGSDKGAPGDPSATDAFGVNGFNMPEHPATGGATPAAKPTPAEKTSGAIKVAGARALGGPVGAGLSYLVGERGPEIFTPGASGGISTNDALGKLANVGDAITRPFTGAGAEQISPSPERIAAAKSADKQAPTSRTFHAGEHHWHIDGGGNPREVRRQVEGCFMDMIRQMESAQSGSLSD